ncbi:hypothetical protein [Rubrobacter indicoceani]|uniref:hypothetical protein n=1 Tax=Rubrobacter indicoceani TaxID=2051957 RepID=UPI000E5B431C|nr:hypothetical protein [Rubrobacter indicoceani]
MPDYRHRILLVRELDAQVSASGCCGRIGGKHSELGAGQDYAHNRREMEAMGEVYRALKKALFDEDVELSVVDPRNAVWLLPAILRDARKHGRPAKETLKSIKNGLSYNSIVFDGKVLFSGRIPAPEKAVEAVLGELKAARVT